MQPKAYLFFNGQANDALQAYSKIFKTQPSALMRMSDGPPEMGIPADRKDWIMHCELPVGGGAIYMSDDFAANAPPIFNQTGLAGSPWSCSWPPRLPGSRGRGTVAG